MKRPIGVILISILLGLFAAVLLFSAFGMLMAAIGIAHHGMPSQPINPSGPPMPSTQALGYLIAAMSFITVLLAAWAIATLVGLIKLKNWARYSVLTMGGLMAALGLLSALAVFAMPSILRASAPSASAGSMHAVMLFVGLFYFIVAAVGACFLVYFNLRSVKAFFLQQYSSRQQPYSGTAGMGNPAYAGAASRSSLAASLATPGGLYSETPPPPPPPGWMPSEPRPPKVPTSIVVIAILAFLGAFSVLVAMLFPIPAFFFGISFPPPVASRLVLLLHGVVYALLGIGLLRLDNRARVGFYAVQALYLLNLLINITPWGQRRYAIVQQAIAARWHTQPVQLGLSFHIALFLLLLVIAAVQIFLIERKRELFH